MILGDDLERRDANAECYFGVPERWRRTVFREKLGFLYKPLSLWKIIPGRMLQNRHVSAAGRLWNTFRCTFKIDPSNFRSSGPLKGNPPGKRFA